MIPKKPKIPPLLVFLILRGLRDRLQTTASVSEVSFWRGLNRDRVTFPGLGMTILERMLEIHFSRRNYDRVTDVRQRVQQKKPN